MAIATSSQYTASDNERARIWWFRAFWLLLFSDTFINLRVSAPFDSTYLFPPIIFTAEKLLLITLTSLAGAKLLHRAFSQIIFLSLVVWLTSSITWFTYELANYTYPNSVLTNIQFSWSTFRNIANTTTLFIGKESCYIWYRRVSQNDGCSGLGQGILTFTIDSAIALSVGLTLIYLATKIPTRIGRSWSWNTQQANLTLWLWCSITYCIVNGIHAWAIRL
jgi:hypothetical protein